MDEHRSRFVGTYEHGLDEKGRMVLPAKMRAQLGETAYLGKLDGCIGLWTVEGFYEAYDQLEAAIGTDGVTMGAVRQFLADAFEVTPDQQGRIIVPQRLRTYAALGSDVVVTGRMKRAEIWDKRAWDALSDAQDRELNTAVKAIGL